MRRTRVDIDRLRSDLRRGVPGCDGPLPGFDPDEADEAPGPLFAGWLRRALDERVPDCLTMTLGTVDTLGRPSSRVLVLRDVECEGDDCAFAFASDAASRKAADLAARPYAALGWYWPRQGRQIRAAGVVETRDRRAAREDFLGRGAASRTAGLVGRMSTPLTGPQEYERERVRAGGLLAADPGAVPPGHTVYLLRAEEIEFYQLAADRFHRRLRYTREGARWAREQLWP